MRRTPLILTLVCGILAAPLLCDAGIVEHDCVCDVAECCADEPTCELDPCSVVYEKQSQRHRDTTTPNVLTPVLVGFDVSPACSDEAITSVQYTSDNNPFPYHDLPLQI